jgi:phosphoribosylformylglycinamidine synthase
MTIGVLKYPGGHGDAEIMHVLLSYFQSDVREIWYKEKSFASIDVLFIGAGFPCHTKNRERQCLNESPALKYLPEFAADGKVLVGIGNGFQVLCESGLLPGKLNTNISGRFINKQVYVKAENQASFLTAGISTQRVLNIPIATEFGNYTADSEELADMRLKGQILFRFCDYQGRITESVNYTGSAENIAAICNKEKNVFGLIPQPERAVSVLWNEADGKLMLSSLLENISR